MQPRRTPKQFSFQQEIGGSIAQHYVFNLVGCAMKPLNYSAGSVAMIPKIQAHVILNVFLCTQHDGFSLAWINENRSDAKLQTLQRKLFQMAYTITARD